MPDTLAHRRELRFWGWGYADEELSSAEVALMQQLGGMVGASDSPVDIPLLADIALPAPRLSPTGRVADMTSITAYDRITHAYGKSLPDSLRLLMGQVPNPPDLVAFPRNEDDLSELIDYATGQGAALIPFGGGTSVCGGVEPDVGDAYPASISVDLQYMNKVLEVDDVSRAALIEGGALGPELEAALKPQGLTLRHFPQSFQFSTLGGWIVTRAGGHFATNYTHIDDLVESVRMITPRGEMESRRLPGSGAGPSPDRMMLGSEGTMGFVTRAWMRLQERPTFRASSSVKFPTMAQACSAVRAISQSGLFPSNCRLLDPAEGLLNRVGDGQQAILVLAFESSDHPLDAWLARALELAADHGGQWDPQAAKAEGGHREGAAGAWRNQFLRAPYFRNYLTPHGVMADTFETAITWDRFDEFYTGVRERLTRVIREVTGADGMISCRFTHVYPDGPAPYFTFYAKGMEDGDLGSMLSRWREIKLAANEAVTSLGGTVTHHHAVGRDHRPKGYDNQAPALFLEAFSAARNALDPNGIMNPGVLIDTPQGGKTGGILG
jgi:alkyldihydroxyacetonephosphate synthase